MAIWYRGWKGLPERLKELELDGRPYKVEAYHSPSGQVWYRERGEQESSDLKRIDTEHHPDFASTGDVGK
jgi:hypothetical protein